MTTTFHVHYAMSSGRYYITDDRDVIYLQGLNEQAAAEAVRELSEADDQAPAGGPTAPPIPPARP